MFNSGHADHDSATPRQSLAEWLRTVTRDLFQVPGESPGSAESLYAGMAIAPGVAGPSEAAAFTGQLSRLHISLNSEAAADPENDRQKDHKKRASGVRRADSSERPVSRMLIPASGAPNIGHGDGGEPRVSF